MGLLRAALAMAVVLGHTLSGRHRLVMIDPAAAVELFFIISGFYMGLILSEKYVGPKSFKLFITNRLLRLFPAYLLVLVISVLLWLLLGKRAGTDGPAGLFRLGLKPSALILLAGVQLLIVAQEIFLFARVGPGGSLIPTAHFQNHPPIWQYAVVPPAWSLSLELYFYAIAPFLIRLRTRTLVIVACCSFCCRLYIYERLRLTNDPWTYRFFPSELMFFTAGILAYRAYAVIRAKPPSRFVLWAVTCCVLLLAILYQSLPGSRVIAGFEPRQWACYAVTWAAMPLLFLWSNPVSGNNRWLRTIDRWIGEMSYPIYITHFFILQMLTLPTHRQLSLQFLLIGVVTITLVTSALLLKFVMQPIEHIRSKRARTVQSRALQYAVDVVTP